ncbi:MAG: biotin--[acetyl-CoA-carboxylase] ligase [Beijerinckiaceae bacterium]|nr:biotin--[acetyl-CoA-carboxylase] ligase [Beijerinckiaceae bacterium]
MLKSPGHISGTRLERLDSLDSTNEEAMRRARAGDPGGLWIVADAQTSGRGRHGRVWTSPHGNLAASLLLIDPAPSASAPQLGFVAGVALASAVADLMPGRRAPQLKWPNDLVAHGAKLSGLLLEASQISGGRLACVIGFGVNVLAHPDGLPYAATSLRALGCDATATDLMENLRKQMALWLERWQGGTNFEAVRTAWLSHAAGLGREIRVVSGSREVEGVFRTLDATGQLIMDTKAGPEMIAAGEVFLPRTATGDVAAGREM